MTINDVDGARYEPHYEEITGNGQAQIHELIMVDSADDVTTGLLHGVRYVKNNLMLPAGFDKAAAEVDVAVHGAAIAEGPSAAYQWIENLRLVMPKRLNTSQGTTRLWRMRRTAALGRSSETIASHVACNEDCFSLEQTA